MRAQFTGLRGVETEGGYSRGQMCWWVQANVGVIVANQLGPGSGVDTYPRTATTLDDDELDDFSATFGDLGVASAVDEEPTRAFRAAMNAPR